MSSPRTLHLISTLLAAAFVVAGTPVRANSQQLPPNAIAAGCGTTEANFKVIHDKTNPAPQQIPSGKALVYIVEYMDPVSIFTTKVNIGFDGNWLGAMDDQTYIAFLVDPGIHHLCAVYQGKTRSIDSEGHTLLLQLHAEAGKTYYLRYHALFSKEVGGAAFFDPVDEDEGQLLVGYASHTTSILKKK